AAHELVPFGENYGVLVIGLLAFGRHRIVVAKFVFFRAGRLALLTPDADRCVIQQCLAHGEFLLAAASAGFAKRNKNLNKIAKRSPTCLRTAGFCGQKYPGLRNFPQGPGLGCSCSRRACPDWRSRGWLSAGSAEFRRISFTLALTLSRRCRT